MRGRAIFSVTARNLDWNGVGQLNLQSLQVADLKLQDPQHAVVTLLALFTAQLMELDVAAAAWWPPASPPGCLRRRRLRRRRPRAVRARWPKAS
jgi:hypothetical protein